MTEQRYVGLLSVAYSYVGVVGALEMLSTWAKPARTTLEPHDAG